MVEKLPICERLRVVETVVHDADEYRETNEFVNPDGPQAADTIEALYGALAEAQKRYCNAWCDKDLNDHTQHCKAMTAALESARK